MISFERSADYALIHRILTRPACYSRMRNDAAPPVEAFQVGPRQGVEYVIAREDGRPAAVFLLIARLDEPDPEVHCCFTPHVWGRTRPITAAFLEWVWAHTPYRRVIGPVPSYNALALRLAKTVGFVEFHVEPHAGTRNGRPFDRILTEAIRP